MQYFNDNVKVKSIYHTHEECWWGAHLPYLGLEPVQVDEPLKSVAHGQTYSYLPSRKTSLPRNWYQIILLGDRGTCV